MGGTRNAGPGRLADGLVADWDSVLNGDLTPADVAPYSHRKVWWCCVTCGHSWPALVSSRSRGRGCPACNQPARRGPLVIEHPELAAEWDTGRNGPLDPKITSGSVVQAWWRCATCGNGWRAIVNNRARRGTGCPECANARRRAGTRGRLAAERPDLAAQWDVDRNEGSPEQVSCGSVRMVWWRCAQEHRWQAKVNDRARARGKRGTDCPFCAGRYSQPLARTHPQLAAEWDTEANGFDARTVTAGANVLVWWRCAGHGHLWQARVADRVSGATGCPRCAGRFPGPVTQTHPHLLDEWVAERNGPVPGDLTGGSSRRYFWRCALAHVWRAPVRHRTQGAGCPTCAHQRTGQRNSRLRAGEQHPSAKLTAAQVTSIRTDSRTIATIARDYGVASSTISDIRQRRGWRHLS